PEDIPPELARALHVSISDPILIDADRITAAFFILPWLARAEPTELYLPADIVDALRQPWSMESTMRLLQMPRRQDGVRGPRKVEKTPGRNDPCPFDPLHSDYLLHPFLPSVSAPALPLHLHSLIEYQESY